MAPVRLLIPSLIALSILAASPSARADGAFRTVLVIDASSSMKRTDPKELRKVAAELYVDLARTGDQIAVTGFDGAVRESTSFVTIGSPATRDEVKAAIRGVGNNGNWTDFTAGLLEAKRLFDTVPENPGDQELIVFLTDGKCDPDPKGPFAEKGKTRKDREAACRDEVLGGIVGDLGRARVYAIGLSKAAPKEFLDELGRRTGGVGIVTEEASELPRSFAGVYARLLGSRLHEGSTKTKAAEFEAFAGAEILDVVVVGRVERTPKLFDPTGAEIPIHNREPDQFYFVGAKEYRFWKIADPAPGIWKLELLDAGEHTFATLQHFDLTLAMVDPVDAVETGRSFKVRARLASPKGAAPTTEFLDRHRMIAFVRAGDDEIRIEMTRGEGGVFEGSHTANREGSVEIGLVLEPGADGVLSRSSGWIHTVKIVPPLRLVAAPLDFGELKEGTEGKATLDLTGSEIGVAVTLSIYVRTKADRITPQVLELKPKGERKFPLTLAVHEKTGDFDVPLTVKPTIPKGFEDREIEVPLTAVIVPLTFWERFGLWIEIAAGVLLAIVLLVGFAMPARFKKRAILYYKDVRDPDLPRQSSYPIGVKAKAGFFRAARLLLGPTGPVRRGGKVLLVAGGGNSVTATPLSAGAKVHRVRDDDDDDDDDDDEGSFSEEDKQEVFLTNRSFRMTPSVRYQIEGAGLVFWYK